MNILLTGAFGNVGVSTLEALAGRGHLVRCFDVSNKANRKAAARFLGKVDIHWGDLRNAADVAQAIEGQDVVLHLAAVIPPVSEKAPELARAVNVGGTRALIDAAKLQARPPRFVLASSVSVHGRDRDDTHLLRASDPLNPSDHYSGHKVECEAMVRESGLDWSILRLTAVMPLKLGQMDPIMFEIGLDNQVDFVHTRDVGLAFANSADSAEIGGKVLLIGGGPSCHLHYREFFRRFLDTLGVGMLP
jgi:nucleoside-diphosphate-sugar epimerase